LDGLFSFDRGAIVLVLLEDSSHVAGFSLFARCFLGCNPSLAASLFLFWFFMSLMLLQFLQLWGFRLQASGCFFSSSTLVRLLDLVFTFPSSFAMAITYVVKAFVLVPIHL